MTLDQLIGTHGVPHLCKIDVGGFEAHVLAGLSCPLQVVVFEFSEGLRGTRDCLNRLLALGDYLFAFRVGRSPRICQPALAVDSLLRALPEDLHGDIVAVLQERMDLYSGSAAVRGQNDLQRGLQRE